METWHAELVTTFLALCLIWTWWRLQAYKNHVRQVTTARMAAQARKAAQEAKRVSTVTSMPGVLVHPPLAPDEIIESKPVEPPLSPAALDAMIEEQHYVILWTMVGFHLQSDVVAESKLGSDKENIERLILKGAIRKLEAHEIKSVKDGQLPGARFIGAVQPQQGLREPLQAQERKLEDEKRAAARKKADEDEVKRVDKEKNEIILAMAKRLGVNEVNGFPQ